MGVAASAAAFILYAVGHTAYLYSQIKHTAKVIYEEPSRPVYISQDPETARKTELPAELKSEAPFTVLLLGVDQRMNDVGRSDTIVVMSVNPAKQSILMFSIPRDTRTEIIGHGTTDKINHAYAFGGIDMSLQTVEHFLDYPIDYYVKVNMESFERLIDLIGGVEVYNPFAFESAGHSFPKGWLKLDGEEALLYSRMRYEDPRGDLGRNTRQRDILQSIMRHSVNLQNITKINSILSEIGGGVKTNVSFDDMKTFMNKYRQLINRLDTIEVAGTGRTINGIWYYLVSTEEQLRIHDLMKKHQEVN
ncbi:LCP family glycopolymer transferase [Paenibacillus xylaniclasticus]|uniref:LCP family glycopolymer transferase n=1 Tax=Paenibacillus xylaniclasticus TaxID=588083 RepID=UPI00157FA2DA|nr:MULTISPECIES: LCP family protein [Paenibacillus]GFN29845.1 transcriptional regulator LytR [Paenibacillus curdlanolyticus]